MNCTEPLARDSDSHLRSFLFYYKVNKSLIGCFVNLYFPHLCLFLAQRNLQDIDINCFHDIMSHIFEGELLILINIMNYSICFEVLYLKAVK